MKSNRLPLATLLFCLLFSSFALAATYTWTGAAGDFIWSTSSANWNAGSGDVVWSQGDDALFDGEPTTQVEVDDGAMEFNLLTVQNIADGSMTIDRISGNDADHLVATGDATVNVPTGTSLRLPQVRGVDGLTLVGGGTLSSSRGFIFSGGINILDGTLQHKPNVGNGTVTLLDTSGTADARLYIRGVNNSWLMENDVVVQAGSTGMATIENHPSTSSGFNPTLSGDLSLGSSLTVWLNGTQSNSITLSGAIGGAGALLLAGHSTNSQSFILTGDSSAHTGGIELTTNPTNKTLQLDGTFGTSNIMVGNGVAIAGDGTLVYNIVGDTADLISRGAGGSLDLTGLTLMPQLSGAQTQEEYVLSDSTTGVIGPFLDIVNYGFYTFTVEYAGTAQNPDAVVLTVAIPEPASAALLALAGLVGLRRRGRKALLA